MRDVNTTYTILYSDGKSITQSEAEVSQWLDVRNQPEWTRLVAEAKQGFAYLRGRLDGSCNNVNYDCSEMWMALQLVNPST